MNNEFNNSPDLENNPDLSDKKGKFSVKGIKHALQLIPGKLLAILKGIRFPSSPKDGSAASDIKKAFSHLNPKKVIVSLLLGMLAIYLLTGIYIVNPGEQAVIRRFGAVLPQTISEGIHYRLPYPIDKVQKVSVLEVRRADIGMSLPDHIHQGSDTPEDIQLLTGDENIITSQAVVHYKVKDAAQYLYSVNGNSEQLVRFSVEAALVELMANMAVDDILSTGKILAQSAILQNAQETLDLYGAGIQITAFNIQAIIPPGIVASAFLDVTTAKEEKEKAINEANGYYNAMIPKARAEANSIISQAEAYGIEQINSATGDAEKFSSMLTEYQNNSRIYTEDTTKYRLLLETFEKILPKVRKFIVDSADGSVDIKMFDPTAANGLVGN